MSGVQSVERAMAILRAVGETPGGLVDIAERTTLPTSTASRLLTTLLREGAVRRDASGVYKIGPEIVAMAGPGSGSDIVALARRQMIELADELGEAVALSIPSGRTTTTIEQIDAPKPVRAEDWTGTVVPLHAGCVGLVTLAYWEEEDLESYLDDDLESLTGRTVVDASSIRARIQTIRNGEPLWTHGEYVDGISSVAAPIRNERGHAVAALYAYGPSYRFPPEAQTGPRSPGAIARCVTRRATDISIDLGWNENDPQPAPTRIGAA